MAALIPTSPSARQPQVPVGVYYLASSIPPASGVSGTGWFNGPWLIETQELTISYHRVPHMSVCSVDLSLSSGSLTNLVDQTQMAALITASWSLTSSIDAYPVSADVIQPQQFEFYAQSTDYQGMSYGTVDASDLGPRGQVATIVPFYYRRSVPALFDFDPSDVGIGASSMQAATFCYSLSSIMMPSEGNCFVDVWSWGQGGGLGSYHKWAITGQGPTGRKGQTSTAMFNRHNAGCGHYLLLGSFTTGQESLTKAISWIQGIGWSVKQCELQYLPAKIEGEDSWSNYHTGLPNDFLTGIPEYNPNRHDWSDFAN